MKWLRKKENRMLLGGIIIGLLVCLYLGRNQLRENFRIAYTNPIAFNMRLESVQPTQYHQVQVSAPRMEVNSPCDLENVQFYFHKFAQALSQNPQLALLQDGEYLTDPHITACRSVGIHNRGTQVELQITYSTNMGRKVQYSTVLHHHNAEYLTISINGVPLEGRFW